MKNKNKENGKKSHKNYLREITKKYKKGTLHTESDADINRINSVKPAESTKNFFGSSTAAQQTIQGQKNFIKNNLFLSKGIPETLFNSETHIKQFNEYKTQLDKKIELLKEKMALAKMQAVELPKLSYKKFQSINRINIKKNPFINFLQMFNTQDFFNLFRVNKSTKKMIIDAFSFEIKTFIANKFSSLSNSIFSNFYFGIGIQTYFVNCIGHSNLILVIKTQITSTSLINKSVHLQYTANYPCDGEENVLNHFIFDVKKTDCNFWIMKEFEMFQQENFNKAFMQRIMQFKLNDFAEFTVNIITDKGVMNIRKLFWHNIKLFPTPKENFFEFSKENCPKREIIDFNMCRYCELEVMKSEWSDIEVMEHANEVKESLNQVFKENFNIEKILYDDVGYYIFKVYLKPIKEGTVTEIEKIGINLKIVGDSDNAHNEVKKNSLIYDRKNELQIHIGDTLVYYLTRSKTKN